MLHISFAILYEHIKLPAIILLIHAIISTILVVVKVKYAKIMENIKLISRYTGLN